MRARCQCRAPHNAITDCVRLTGRQRDYRALDRGRYRARYLGGVPDEALTNATVEWIRRFHRRANALEEYGPDETLPVTDDFTYEDRRSGGMNFGHLDASAAGAYLASMWDVGSGRPQMSMSAVIAARGDRLAAVVEVIDLGEDTYTEGIVCYGLDPELKRLQRVVIQNSGEVDAAINELDRMYAELDG